VNDAEALLAQLRDIHEPLPPEPLPTAIWWLTAVLAVVLMGIVAFALRRAKLRRTTPTTTIAHHCTLALNEPPEQARLRLARLLRQHVLLSHQEQDAIQASGEPWLHILDNCFNTTWFTEGEGQQFGSAMYSQEAKPLSPETCEKVRMFLEQGQAS